METFEAINTRRSIRKFTNQKVDEKQYIKIIKAAMQAPSARDCQPWHFFLTDERDLLNKIPEVHQFAEMMKTASAAILVCGEFSLEPSPDYIAIDCAAATQNLLLAAHDLGLGAVWLGVYPRKERMDGMIKIFDLPDDIIPISLVALGYTDEKIKPEERYKPDRVHINKW